ncbi:MAG: hypothetical protein JO317_07635 [Verrucomicrobiae bacterium]|nr:hypothetical protein [Verrucomicrobiae bacterium]
MRVFLGSLALAVVAASCVCRAPCEAGVVVFKNNTALVSKTVTKTGDQVTVTQPEGPSTFKNEDLLWVSTDPAIDSLWAAAQAAEKEGQSAAAAVLAKETLHKEPAHSAEARQLLFQIEQKAPKPETAGTNGNVKAFFEKLTTPRQPITNSAPVARSEWQREDGWMNAEDTRLNLMVAGAIALLLLFVIWKITIAD